MDIKCPFCGKIITTTQQKATYPTPITMPCPYCKKDVNLAEESQKVWQNIRDATKKPLCPQCNADNSYIIQKRGLFKATPMWECRTCGYTWKY